MSDEVIRLHGEIYCVDQCGTCGVFFIIPQVVYENHRRNGGFSHCSNGHQWGFRSGTEQAAQEALRRERDRLKQDAARLKDEIAAEKSRADKAEKKYLQARRRAAAGVCPCCNRTFANVQKHMLSKHSNVVSIAQKATT